MFSQKSIKALAFSIFFLFQLSSHAEVSRIEILKREQISAETLDFCAELPSDMRELIDETAR